MGSLSGAERSRAQRVGKTSILILGLIAKSLSARVIGDRDRDRDRETECAWHEWWLTRRSLLLKDRARQVRPNTFIPIVGPEKTCFSLELKANLTRPNQPPILKVRNMASFTLTKFGKPIDAKAYS